MSNALVQTVETLRTPLWGMVTVPQDIHPGLQTFELAASVASFHRGVS
jgi:hypothetical protein